jgi:hypothetical protein
MWASGLSPVRQIRTKRKMRAYSSGSEFFFEQTAATKHWPVYIHISFLTRFPDGTQCLSRMRGMFGVAL